MIRKHNLDNAYQMVEGQFKFLDRNTGLTTDNKTQHYVFNPDNVLANNRHFIAGNDVGGDARWRFHNRGTVPTDTRCITLLPSY